MNADGEKDADMDDGWISEGRDFGRDLLLRYVTRIALDCAGIDPAEARRLLAEEGDRKTERIDLNIREPFRTGIREILDEIVLGLHGG